MSHHDTKLIISLKSSSVEVSVFSKENGVILFSNKKMLLFKETLNSTTFIKESFTALKQILKTDYVRINQSLKRGSEAVVFFYSPWFLGELISLEEKTKTVSLFDLMHKQNSKVKKDTHKQIENKIIDISVNGYHLQKIRDIKHNDIELSIFRSYISKEIHEEITQIIKEQTHHIDEIRMVSSSMESFELIKEMFPNEDNFCFLNIGGEITEVGIVDNDIFVDHATFPMGKHSFSRKLNMFLDHKENIDVVSFIGDANSDYKLNSEKNSALEKLKKEWISKIQKTLNSFNGDYPKKVFILTEEGSISFFRKILEESELKDSLQFIIINQQNFENNIKFSDKKSHRGTEYLISAHYSQIKD